MVPQTDKFSIAFARSPLALTITSLSTGRLVDVNDGFVRISGYSREEAIGRTPDELGLWINPEVRGERFQKLLAGQAVPEIESRFRIKDGSEIIGVIGSAIVDIDGERCVLSSMLDITARKRAEQALIDHERRYRAIVESQSEMVCRFRRDGTILFANAAYAHSRGTTSDAIVGANFWDFIPAAEHAAVSELLDSLSADHPQVRIENQFTTTGGVRWTLWTNCALTFAADGRPLEYQSTGLDITDRKRAEEALRESERRYRHIFETAGVSIWDEDFTAIKRAIRRLRADGVLDLAAFFAAHPEWVDQAIRLARTRAVNAATLRMFAAPDESVLLTSPEAILLPESRKMLGGALLAFAEGRQRFEAESRVRTLDGRTLDVLFTITFPEANQPVDSVLVTLTDITERKRVEAHFRELAEALQQSNRVKDEFLATLSHELRTPLNAVIGWAHMLRNGLPADLAGRAIESLERNARAQAKLIDDLLDMSRIVSDRLQIAGGEVLLSSVVHAAVDTVRPAAVSKGVELATRMPAEDGLCVRGDADRLRQVLWNLLSNAIKFTPSGGRVDLELNDQATHAEIVVRDSGEGIAPEFLPHVFERFRQADATSTRRHGGIGLGLSIARHLAEAHGGSLTAYSEGRNRGASFVLRLPKLAGWRAPVPDRAQGSSDMPSLTGTAILVVDDDPDARELFRVALELAGADVVLAESTDEALARLRDYAVDLLIVEVGLPEHHGIELLRTIRRMPPPAGQLPAIAATAYTTPRERALAFEAGFNAHLAKPMEMDRLLGCVMSLIARRQEPAPNETMR